MNETLFSRRAFILGTSQALLLSTLVGRLYYLQILSGDHYRTLSDKNRIQGRLLPPLRGQIFDRHGKTLATSRKTFHALWLYSHSEEKEELLERIASILLLSAQEKERILHETEKKTRWLPILLKSSLSWKEVATLELYLPELPGVLIEEGQNRFYPEPFSTCHVIGYVGAASEEEAYENPLLALPQMRIGKSGIEKALEETLRGQGSIKQLEVNAKRQAVRELASLAGTPGQDVRLTLDLDLQKKAYELLTPYESGAIALLDCNTGAVLSLVSYPGFDNNLFVNGISQENWQVLLHNPRQALIPKAIAGQYAPGSTFKMIVALAALKAKAINPSTSFTCQGFLELGEHRFHCHSWRHGGHGSVNLSSALKLSCDVYFYQVAAMSGVDAIADMAKKLGLGSVTGIEILGEKAGLVPTRNWKSRVLRRSWQLGETYNVGIGQGYVLATPLQLVVMMAALANGGKLVTPYLIESMNDPFLLDISQEHLALIKEGLFRAVNETGGSAFQGRILEPEWQMSGKTGTSQVKRITQHDRQLGLVNREDRPWEYKEHGVFVGYAPVTAPRFALCVFLEHVGSSKIAVPLARDLLLLAQRNKMNGMENSQNA